LEKILFAKITHLKKEELKRELFTVGKTIVDNVELRKI